MKAFWFVCLIFVCLPAVFPTVARSQDVPSFDASAFSSTEKAGFAFNTLARRQPDFVRWIKSRILWETLTPVDRIAYLQSETKRLQNGFVLYDPRVDLIPVRTDVLFTISSPGTGGGSFLRIEPPDQEVLFFPFLTGDVWIFVLPVEPSFFTRIPLSQEAAERLRTDGATLDTPQKGVLFLSLRPEAVDLSAPFDREGGVTGWGMTAAIAASRLESAPGADILWEYKAPDD